jgi:aminoglycoside 2''-phosphotransferase
MSVPSPERARAAVRQLTPLRADELVELGRGTESVAHLVDGEWVARFPAVPAAQATLRRELALLPALRPALPLGTPVFEHVGRSGAELVFVAYRSISGAPLTADTLDALASDEQEAALACLAEFRRALHAFPVELARRAGVREERDKGAYNRRQRSLHRDLRGLLSRAEIERLDDAFTRYERDHLPDRLTPVLLHADIKPDHPQPQRVALVAREPLELADSQARSSISVLPPNERRPRNAWANVSAVRSRASSASSVRRAMKTSTACASRS